MARQILPQLIDGYLHPRDAQGAALPTLVVDSAAWFAWLADPQHRAFSVVTAGGAVTVRREQQGNGWFWYAYRRDGPRVRKAYVGKNEHVTAERLRAVLATLTGTPNIDAGHTRLCELRLLGTPQVRYNGTVVRLPVKAIALLAYLMITGTPQARAHLLALFWPESTEEAARKNLRNLLWTIRSTLGQDTLLTTHDRIGGTPNLTSDTAELEQLLTQPFDPHTHTLARIQDLYHGPVLDGFTLPDAPDFEVWLTTERERFSQIHSRVLYGLVEQHRQQHTWDAVIEIAQYITVSDPFDETAYQALIEAHARRGERAAALRQYDRLHAILDRELGVAPMPATEAIHEAVMRGAFAPAVAAPQLPPLRRTPVLRPYPFVGRSTERAALDAALAAAQHTPHMVVLSGELGIGKSRLWHEWSSASAVSVVETHCLAATQTLPFAPLLARFGDAHWIAQATGAAGAAVPPWLALLNRLFPSQQDLLARPLLGGLPPSEERHQVFEAFVQALRAVTEPPRALFIDDIHWADQTTLDWIEYCIDRFQDTALLLVVAYRTEDAPPALLQRIAHWERAGSVRRINLQRLSHSETRNLLAHLAVAEPDAQRLIQQSGGNPYYLTELAQADSEALPAVLIDLVRARIDRLSETTRRVLQAAVILEPAITAALLCQISGVEEDETLDALDALVVARLLSEQHDRYVFTHPLAPVVVRAGISRARRVLLHRRAATILEQVGAERLPVFAGQIAAHYREAGDAVRAAPYAVMAGDYALRVAAPAEAADWYRQAIALAPSAAGSIGLGRALMWQGALDEAIAILHTAQEHAHAAGDTERTALALLVLADLATTQNRFAAAAKYATEALELAGDAVPFVAAGAHILIGTDARVRGDLHTANQYVDAALAIATTHHLTEVLLYCAVARSNIRAEQGDMQGAFAAAEDIIRYARQVGHTFYEVIGYNNAAYRATLLGDYATAHTQITAGLHLADERGIGTPRQWLYSTRGELALSEQQWDTAEHWLTRAYTEAERRGNLVQQAVITAHLGRVAHGRGATEQALQQLEQARAMLSTVAVPYQQAEVDLWRGELLLHLGDVAAAARAAQAAHTRLAGTMYHHLLAHAAQLQQRIEAALR